jgi:hypothetical protein
MTEGKGSQASKQVKTPPWARKRSKPRQKQETYEQTND